MVLNQSPCYRRGCKNAFELAQTVEESRLLCVLCNTFNPAAINGRTLRRQQVTKSTLHKLRDRNLWELTHKLTSSQRAAGDRHRVDLLPR
jgi:hypothetical protein